MVPKEWMKESLVKCKPGNVLATSKVLQNARRTSAPSLVYLIRSKLNSLRDCAMYFFQHRWTNAWWNDSYEQHCAFARKTWAHSTLRLYHLKHCAGRMVAGQLDMGWLPPCSTPKDTFLGGQQCIGCGSPPWVRKVQCRQYISQRIKKTEIVILHYYFPISDTLSVVHSFSVILSHAPVWGCVMGVLYQKSIGRFPVPPSRLQHRHH